MCACVVFVSVCVCVSVWVLVRVCGFSVSVLMLVCAFSVCVYSRGVLCVYNYNRPIRIRPEFMTDFVKFRTKILSIESIC